MRFRASPPIKNGRLAQADACQRKVNTMSESNNPGEALYDPGEIGRDAHNTSDRIVVLISNLVAWIFPALMIAICTQVLLRSFGRAGIGPGNQAWMDDLQWWFYGTAVLVGISYAVTTNSHVRVDIFYDRFSKPKMARIDIFALTFLFLPFSLLCFDMTIHYAASSVIANEGSDSPNGLHNLWILKVGMCLCFLLMFFAGWAAYVRRLSVLTEPNLWKQFLFAFPTTMYVVNLVTFYAIWWFIKLTASDPTTGEPLSNRDVSRHDFFDAIELGNQEMPKTVLLALILTPLLIFIARFVSRQTRG